MKYLQQKDNIKRILTNKYELKRTVYKSLLQVPQIEQEIKYNILYNFLKLPKNSNYIRTKNRCILTNRAKSVDRFTKISRNFFRDFALKGYLAGVRKASW